MTLETLEDISPDTILPPSRRRLIRWHEVKVGKTLLVASPFRAKVFRSSLKHYVQKNPDSHVADIAILQHKLEDGTVRLWFIPKERSEDQ